MQSQAGFPKPRQGASLVLSFRLHSRTVVIVGSGKLAASRAFTCLESEAHVVLLGRGGLESACDEIKWRVEQSQVEWMAIEEEAKIWRARSPVGSSAGIDNLDEDEAALHSVLSRLPSVSFLCITDTIVSSQSNTSMAPRSKVSASRLYDIACTYRIPTNTTDTPSLCDFYFPATHRFRSADNNESTALQIGVVTNSKGCRLSSRIAREIVARLPKGIGDAVDNVGRLRDKAKANEQAQRTETSVSTQPFVHIKHAQQELSYECEGSALPSTPNEPVPQVPLENSAQNSGTPGESLTQTQRRMRWVAQVSEYWPLESLASLDDEGIDSILSGTSKVLPRAVLAREPTPSAIASAPTRHMIPEIVPQHSSNATHGRILLVGSGPGHPSLLTLATSSALQSADLILSDKLVPEGVLNAIPKHVELRIARKFPGNADRAQEELMHSALEGAQQGKVVVRLKQGDPMLYARVSSEIEYFTAHGFPPTIVPGLSSALAAPLAAGIPVTARGVAESVAICTGVGKGGKGGRVPPYERATTVLVLMGVARMAEIVRGMMEDTYPSYLPTCVIERGTMPDQRVVQSTLGGIVETMSDPRVGAQRPPGMMVIGWACLGVAEGVEGVSNDTGEGLRDRDLERVKKWLGGERLVIREGLDKSWEDL